MATRRGIAIAGCHGKTTTTGMAAFVLDRCGRDPTVVLGGSLPVFGGNWKHGRGEFLVAEACEYDRSFLNLTPEIAVVNNIDADHLDYYHDLDEIKATFIDFINKVPFYGLAVLCLDDPNLQGLIPQVKKRFITYGLANQADFYATAIEHDADRTAFTVHCRGVTLGRLGFRMPGRHNVLNALAAGAVGMELGLDFPAIAAGFKGFRWVYCNTVLFWFNMLFHSKMAICHLNGHSSKSKYFLFPSSTTLSKI